MAVDVLQHLGNFGLRVPSSERVIPGDRIDSRISRTTIFTCSFLNSIPQMNHEPGFAARISRRFNRHLPILQKSLGVGECLSLFRGACGWKQTYLGPDFFSF